MIPLKQKSNVIQLLRSFRHVESKTDHGGKEHPEPHAMSQCGLVYPLALDLVIHSDVESAVGH